MSKTTTDIGDNSNNNQVYQGNTVNIPVNSENNKKSKKIFIIFGISIFIIAIIALLLFFYFSKQNKNSVDEGTQVGALPIQNIQQEEIVTATSDEPGKDLTKNEIIELYAKAQAVYNDWIDCCKYDEPESENDKSENSLIVNILDGTIIKECTDIDYILKEREIFYAPVYHESIKSVSNVIDYCCQYFLPESSLIDRLKWFYKDYNGKLYYAVENKGDGGSHLTSFSIKKLDNKNLKLVFKFSNFDNGTVFSETTTMVFQNNKWLFTEDFNPSINVEDPIVKDNNVTLQKINDEYIVMYDEPRMGRVINTNGNGINFRTTPEKNDDNLICTIDENTYLKVLGYDKYNPEYLYVTNDKEYGFICSKDGNNKYFEYKK